MVFTASSLPEGHNDGVENDARFPKLTLQLVCLAGSNHKPGSGGIFIGGCFSKYRFPAAFGNILSHGEQTLTQSRASGRSLRRSFSLTTEDFLEWNKTELLKSLRFRFSHIEKYSSVFKTQTGKRWCYIWLLSSLFFYFLQTLFCGCGQPVGRSTRCSNFNKAAIVRLFFFLLGMRLEISPLF